MLKRVFETRSELDEFVDKIINDWNYQEFIIRFENGLWILYW